MLIHTGTETRIALIASLAAYQPRTRRQREILSKVCQLGCLVAQPLPHWEWDVEALQNMSLEDLRDLHKHLQVNRSSLAFGFSLKTVR
jgi:hypothetical protein